MVEIQWRKLWCWKQQGIQKPSEMPETNRIYVIDISPEEVNSYITSGVEEKFTYLNKEAAGVEMKCQPKIQKIPSMLRDNNNFKNYYEPMAMAIGPYHHGNSNLKETEKVKLKLATLFIEEHNIRKEVLYSKIKREIKDLRKCYLEEAITSFPDDDLAWMFFVDGCALLHYIYCSCSVDEKTLNEIKRKIKVDHLTFAQRDVFLLENQLPYRVFILLISCMEDTQKWQMTESIENFITKRIQASGEHKQLEHGRRQCEDPIHLLDLLRTRLLQSEKENQMSCSILINNFFEFIREPVKNLMECIGKAFENFPSKQTNDMHFFRNVTELKAAGIQSRPNHTSRLTDITFSLGTLKLPPIVVDDSTASMFMNLIAYEMCPDFFNDFGVSSYIVFLDTLIDQAQDVKELRDKHILHHVLGSDEEVAKLFNEIGTNIVPNLEIYSDVREGIQKRYGNKLMTWIALLNHQYFRNPWSLLAFCAATVVLASTVTQTVYTILGHYKTQKKN